MTIDAIMELGRQAVACRHWHWCSGMLVRDASGRRVGRILDDYVEATTWRDGVLRVVQAGDVPDLSDAATVAGALALVREAYDDEQVFIGPVSDGWEIDRAQATGETEGEAVVDALRTLHVGSRGRR